MGADLSRRGFLTALLASPLIAKLNLELPETFSLQEFASKAAYAKPGDIFLVSQSMFNELWKALNPEDHWLNTEVAQAGFDHMLFHGKPVIWYPDGEREQVAQDLAHHLGKEGRLNITEIK